MPGTTEDRHQHSCRDCGTAFEAEFEDRGVMTTDSLEIVRRCRVCRDKPRPHRRRRSAAATHHEEPDAPEVRRPSPTSRFDGRFVLALGMAGLVLSLAGITHYDQGEAFGDQATTSVAAWYSMFVLTFWLSLAIVAGGVVLTIFTRRS